MVLIEELKEEKA